MDAGSKSRKGFTDEDDDDEEFGRREGSSRKGLGGDGKGGGDHKASTPRSKHSATEQRRRRKINDRFQLLRNLIPHSDQKRDKASFLLEVIEYIQFLQEKVQKYESGYPGWGQESTKLMPWKNSQISSEGIADPCRVIHGDPSSPGFVISGDNAIPSAPSVLTREHTIIDPENVNSGLHNKATTISAPLQLYGSDGEFAQPQERLVSGSEDATSQSQWLRQCSGSVDIPIEQDLTIDDGTINISSEYSHRLFSALSDALQNSGIDMAQASISVKINLGRRAIGGSLSAIKDHDDPSFGDQAIGCSQIGNSAAESQQANKRLKPDKS